MEALGTDGRYELRDQVGQSPRSTVHRAMDLRRRVAVTIKRLDASKVPSVAVGKYAESVAALKKSPVAAAVLPLEIVAHDPGPYVVSAALEGESLESALAAGALQWPRAVQIVASLATTLAAVATASGQSHRALKPTNVWLAPDGNVLVLDYGVAALGSSAPLRRGNLLLEYRAPEQLDGSVGDARSDVFTLAVLLVELTTGVHPFAGATAYQAAQKLSQTPPDLAELTRGMSTAGAREASKLLTQALASEPDDRPGDVAAFATLLAYVRPLVGTPSAARHARAEPEPESDPPPQTMEPSTLQSLPQLRQLLVQRSAEEVAAPVIATPAAPVTATPATPATAPVTATPATPAAPPPAAVVAPPAPIFTPPPATPTAAPARAREPPTEVAVRQEIPRPLPAPVEPRRMFAASSDDRPRQHGTARWTPAPVPVAPAREEHTVIDRPPTADTPPRAERTVVDYAMPTAAAPRAPAATGGGERTEILRRPTEEDDEENRPTVAMIRGPIPLHNRIEPTLMLPDQTVPDAKIADRSAATSSSDRKIGPAPPSAKVQWTLIAVNAICVLLVLAVLAFSFLR